MIQEVDERKDHKGLHLNFSRLTCTTRASLRTRGRDSFMQAISLVSWWLILISDR